MAPYLALNYIITFICFTDTHLLLPIMSLYALSIGASVGAIGIIVGLYSAINTLANIFFGRLIDRVGYKSPLIFGLFGDALCMFGYTLCQSPVCLALLRGLHGLAGGIAGPATMSFTGQRVTRGKRGRGMGFYGAALALASLIGYGLSGILASRLGYKAVFYFGSALLFLGGILALAMPRGKPIARPEVVVGEELRKIGSLLKRRGLIISYCSVFAQYFAFGSVVTLLPLYVKGLGMEAFQVAMLLATFTIAFIFLQLPSGFLSDKVGRWIPVVAGLSLSVVSLVALPTLKTFTSLAAVMALYGMAYSLLFPSISALITDYTDHGEQGLATGIFHALLTAGVGFGAPFMGWVAELTGIELGLALSSGPFALTLLILLLIGALGGIGKASNGPH
ncbi:MAG: MFS transporter [Anaerolineae bacterium]|nr:MFS transporter [Anaerolineae bacterium]MDW8102032.1 MFS transporter [Anaerolineae bacterium]